MQQQKALNVMVGRKRKRGYREPNGRAQRGPAVSKLDLARQLNHRRGLSDENIVDQRAECQFGRFAINKVITIDQYHAGIRWREVVMAYRTVLHSPSEFPKSIAGALVGGGGGDRYMSDEEAIRRKTAYNESYEAVESHAGRTCMIALNDATVHERHVETWRMVHLRAALDVLVGLAYRARRRAN